MTLTRYRAPIPPSASPTRVGRIRLGEQVATKDGTKTRPAAVDYFRVVEDESGVTPKSSADAFHRVFGERPTVLPILLIGQTTEDVTDYAWQRYGGDRLQRRCEGPGGQCSVRSSAGDWVDGPCQCDRERLGVDHPKRCDERLSLQFLLPDVEALGVWDLVTGSAMSRDAIFGFLQMVETIRGGLSMLGCELRVVMRPGKEGGLVPTVGITSYDFSPRQAIVEAGTQPPAPHGLIEGGLDKPDELLDNPTLKDGQAAPDPPPPASDPPPAAPAEDVEPLGAQPAGDPPTAEDEAAILRDNVDAQIRFLSPELRARLQAHLDRLGVRPTRNNLIEKFGAMAADLAKLVEALDADEAKAAQTTLDTGPEA